MDSQKTQKRRWLMGKMGWMTLIGLLLPTLIIAPHLTLETAHAQSAKKLKSQEEEIRAQMVVMSRQLGVTCTTCHKTENFKSDELETFRVAREHMKLTQLLIDNGMDGSKNHSKADCYLCHRGKLNPDSHEKVDPMVK